MGIIGGVLSSLITNSLRTGALEPIQSNAYVPATIQAVSPSGSPYALAGDIDTLTLQNNPEEHKYPQRVAEYVEMKALGLKNSTMHYVGGERKAFAFPFVLEDYFDGPPHATRDSQGNMVYNGFTSLADVQYWLDLLTEEVEDWGHPPFVRVTWGSWSELGLVRTVDYNGLAKYPDGADKLLAVTMEIQPEPILVARDTTHFRVR